MNFQELEKFRKNLINRKRSITTEETTKISLILPLFRILGYDTENPEEVKAEYACDAGVKTSEKVDLAILIDGEVKMLVECKSAKTKLNSNHLNQLLRYYSVTDCRIGVLTNGVEYRFFTANDYISNGIYADVLKKDLDNMLNSSGGSEITIDYFMSSSAFYDYIRPEKSSHADAPCAEDFADTVTWFLMNGIKIKSPYIEKTKYLKELLS